MPNAPLNLTGLTDEEARLARVKFGVNQLIYKKENRFIDAFLRTVKEPMLMLLIVAATIYFVSGKTGDGIFLLFAILFQTSISLYQYSRSKNALEKLKQLSQPNCQVIRNGKVAAIKSEDLVIGDFLMVEEGTAITDDGTIIHSSDFSVNESILTGESMPFIKDKSSKDNTIFSGTTVASGLAIATITAIGNQTKLGKIGTSLAEIEEEKTPLEIQIANFVKKMAISGAIVFLLVWAINFYHSRLLLSSLLQSLTLARRILPEEIPVAFTTFMAIGAWRLMKKGIVVKQMKTVETLGSATVICVDKTGTLTENKMSVAQLYLLSTNTIFSANEAKTIEAKELISIAMWASEPIPFDPMEIALHKTYTDNCTPDERPNYKIVHEYALEGKPPMMTHVFEDNKGNRIIAAKGAPEAIIAVSKLATSDSEKAHHAIKQLAKEGYRVLGIASAISNDKNYPAHQQELPFIFIGLIAFYDPPKKNIQKVLNAFYDAGIAVKIITGDNQATTSAIAKQIGFRGYENCITGDKLMEMTSSELKTTVMTTAIFCRMYPEAKLKIINALKSNDQIVAMTGDGVNDGPALKAAHIGIAMGKKGTEIAKQAASLILVIDDLSKMIQAVAMGRKIYANLKKAIQYIISIHIPIILIVFIPLALGWVYPTLFSPVHIIFLEIIMGPTSSIIYENEPIEKNTMKQPPKALTTTFFNWKELSVSIIQGLVIALAAMFIYQFAVRQGNNKAVTRTMTFTVLIVANVFLTLINRSFYYSIITTLKYKNKMVWAIIATTLILLALLLFVPTLTRFFDFQQLSISQLTVAILVGFTSVIWFEVVKMFKSRNVTVTK